MACSALPLAVALLVILAEASSSRQIAAAVPFDIVWSGLWPCCAGQSAFNLTAYPVLQEKRLGWFGTTFGLYEQSFPPLGLPQTVDLASHRAKVAHDVTHDGGLGRNVSGGIVPAGKDMCVGLDVVGAVVVVGGLHAPPSHSLRYCCIDWEDYTPVIFDHGAGQPTGGCPGPHPRYSMPGALCSMYNQAMNASIALVLQRQPWLNRTAAAALAAAEFNAAARELWTATLEVAESVRPDCHWGFYGKPETEDIVPPFVDAYDRAVGDAYQWMFDAATAIYPSTYLHYNATSSPPPLGPRYNSECVLYMLFLCCFCVVFTLHL